MKHYISTFILFITISSMAISLSSCSKSDEGDENNETLTASSSVEKTIIGKWKLEKKGMFPWTGEEQTLLFQKDNTVYCSSGYGDYQGTFIIKSSTFSDGRILFTLIITRKDDGSQTPYFGYLLQKNKMALQNENLIAIVDNTEYYIKIK